jgi:hypothetical protein
MPKTFPEDIDCVIRGKTASQGSIYISNIEAAENIETLKSISLPR